MRNLQFLGGLTEPLTRLGLVMGVASLVPHLDPIVLVLSLIWTVWLGVVMLSHRE